MRVPRRACHPAFRAHCDHRPSEPTAPASDPAIAQPVHMPCHFRASRPASRSLSLAAGINASSGAKLRTALELRATLTFYPQPLPSLAECVTKAHGPVAGFRSVTWLTNQHHSPLSAPLSAMVGCRPPSPSHLRVVRPIAPLVPRALVSPCGGVALPAGGQAPPLTRVLILLAAPPPSSSPTG